MSPIAPRLRAGRNPKGRVADQPPSEVTDSGVVSASVAKSFAMLPQAAGAGCGLELLEHMLGVHSASLAVNRGTILQTGINGEIVRSILGDPSKFTGVPAVAFAHCGDIAVL